MLAKRFYGLVATSVLAMIALTLFGEVTARNVPAMAFETFILVMITAAMMDLVSEWKARRSHDSLVAVWPLHRVQFTEPTLAALADRDIASFAQGRYFRSLFFFFAPYVPIMIHVPADKADEAREVISTLFRNGDT